MNNRQPTYLRSLTLLLGLRFPKSRISNWAYAINFRLSDHWARCLSCTVNELLRDKYQALILDCIRQNLSATCSALVCPQVYTEFSAHMPPALEWYVAPITDSALPKQEIVIWITTPWPKDFRLSSKRLYCIFSKYLPCLYFEAFCSMRTLETGSWRAALQEF